MVTLADQRVRCAALTATDELSCAAQFYTDHDNCVTTDDIYSPEGIELAESIGLNVRPLPYTRQDLPASHPGGGDGCECRPCNSRRVCGASPASSESMAWSSGRTCPPTACRYGWSADTCISRVLDLSPAQPSAALRLGCSPQALGFFHRTGVRCRQDDATSRGAPDFDLPQVRRGLQRRGRLRDLPVLWEGEHPQTQRRRPPSFFWLQRLTDDCKPYAFTAVQGWHLDCLPFAASSLPEGEFDWACPGCCLVFLLRLKDQPAPRSVRD